MTETNLSLHLVKNGDFINLKFTGYVEGKPFDSNILEDLKKLNEKAEPQKTIIIVGKEMVVRGLDSAIIGKEFGKEYKITVSPKEGFGPRHKELIRTIPLKVFAHQRVMPKPGAAFVLDNQLARVIAVSGARVITDFNNPLAGKEIEYKFTAVSIVDDLKEKAEAVCKLLLHFIPKIEIDNGKIILNGPKILEEFIRRNEFKFKELLNADIEFKELQEEKEQVPDLQ